MGKPLKPNRFEMRLDDDMIRALDAWRRARPEIPSRAEAMRHLTTVGLSAEAEIARLRALLAAAGVDPDKPEGEKP